MKLAMVQPIFTQDKVFFINGRTPVYSLVLQTIIGTIKIVPDLNNDNPCWNVQIYPLIKQANGNAMYEHEVIAEDVPTLEEAKKIATAWHEDWVIQAYDFIKIVNSYSIQT